MNMLTRASIINILGGKLLANIIFSYMSRQELGVKNFIVSIKSSLLGGLIIVSIEAGIRRG